jgi:hypothetical protein
VADFEDLAWLFGELRHGIISADPGDTTFRDIDPRREAGVGRKDVDDIAAHGEFARFVDTVVRYIAERVHLCSRSGHVDCVS